MVLLSHSHLQAYSIPEIVAKTKPAVVEIVAMDEKGSPTTLGTGFFISSDGLVATNFHVIKGATSLSAVNNNGAIFLFERVVTQPVGVDLAILKFRASDVPFLELGKSATTVEGQKVIVIGNPTGLTGSVSDGIISAFREKRSLIQITAPLSPGSSGSPIMNEDGQVIGVATLQIVEGQNLNFAIPVEKVSAALGWSTAQPFASPYPSGTAVGVSPSTKKFIVMQPVRRFEGDHGLGVSSVAFSPDGHLLVSAGDSIRLWDEETAKEIRRFDPRVRGVNSGRVLAGRS